jgi:hypothetical protein
LVWVAGPIFLLEEIPSLLVHVLVLHCIEARPGSIFAEVSSALGLACRFSPEARRRTQSSSSISFSVLAPVFSYRRAAAESFVFFYSPEARRLASSLPKRASVLRLHSQVCLFVSVIWLVRQSGQSPVAPRILALQASGAAFVLVYSLLSRCCCHGSRAGCVRVSAAAASIEIFLSRTLASKLVGIFVPKRISGSERVHHSREQHKQG